MLAAIHTSYGPPEVLSIQEVPTPMPKDNELLVRVYATTVNRTDCSILQAKPFIMRFFTGLFRPRLNRTGSDFAGIVEAVGKKVSTYQVGQKIFGFNENFGSHAQYICIPGESPVSQIPPNISYDEAAATSEGAHYAYNMIRKAKLNAGDHVLVNGATGAIGSAAVQLLRYFGCQVTAVCGTAHVELIRSLGAVRVIDYQKEDFTLDGSKYHCVMDAVGKSSFGKCKSLLMPGGVYMSSDLGPGCENIYLPLITAITNEKKVVFPIPIDIKGSLQLLTNLLETGQFKPVIDRRYPLEKIKEAFHYVLTGQKIGNVLLNI